MNIDSEIFNKILKDKIRQCIQVFDLSEALQEGLIFKKIIMTIYSIDKF